MADFKRREADLVASLTAVAQRQKSLDAKMAAAVAKDAKKARSTGEMESRRKSQLLLQQENSILQLKEQVGRLDQVRKAELAKAKDADSALAQLRVELQNKDGKIAELQESLKSASKTVEELYEIKATMITAGEEFRKLKISLNSMSQENEALKRKQEELTTELSERTKKYEEKIANMVEGRSGEGGEGTTILRLQASVKDSRSILAHWQKEIDTKTAELSKASTQVSQQRIQIAYLAEQGRLMLEANRAVISRLRQSGPADEPMSEPELQRMRGANIALGRNLAESEAMRGRLEEKLSEVLKELASVSETKEQNQRLQQELSQLRMKDKCWDAELGRATSTAKAERDKLMDGTQTLARENMTMREQIGKLGDEVERLRRDAERGKRVEECERRIEGLEEQCKAMRKISSGLVAMPEIASVYDSKLKGKEPVQQIACAIDQLIRLLRVQRRRITVG